MENKTFTREDIKWYKTIQDCFEQRCNKICDIFEKYSYEYKWITNFKLLGDEIHGWCLYSQNGCLDDVECYFPVDYLFMSDEELQNIVDERINERNEKERIKQEKKKQAKEEKERQMYEALKQKYDGAETSTINGRNSRVISHGSWKGSRKSGK